MHGKHKKENAYPAATSAFSCLGVRATPRLSQSVRDRKGFERLKNLVAPESALQASSNIFWIKEKL